MKNKIIVFSTALVFVFLGIFAKIPKAAAAPIYDGGGTYIGFTAGYSVFVSCSTPWEATNACGASCNSSDSFPSGTFPYSNYTCAVFGGAGQVRFDQPDDEGQIDLNGSAVCSYYGCGCNCQATAANNCSMDTLFHGCNKDVNISSGATFSVTGINDCRATGNGGVFGGASGSATITDGQTCCLAGYEPTGAGVCSPIVPTPKCIDSSGVVKNAGDIETSGSGTCAGTRTCANLPTGGQGWSAWSYPPSTTSCNDSIACTTSDHCNGSGSCVGTNTPVNGACSSPLAAGSCAAGTPANIVTSGGTTTWNCNGSCGGTNTSCSATQTAINGLCAVMPNCSAGTATNVNLAACTWTCQGANGGTNASCSLARVDGACGASAGACVTGSSANVSTSNGVTTWNCEGGCGGTTASCSSGTPVATHLACQNGACASVPGAGVNQCTSDSQCRHMGCYNQACVSLSGGGANLCSSNTECEGECYYNSDCPNDNPCEYAVCPVSNTCVYYTSRGQHLACVDGACVLVNDTSVVCTDQCSSDTECAPQDFTVALSPPQTSVPAGSFYDYLVTVAPVNGFNSTVIISASTCPTGSNVTCSFPNGNTILGGNGSKIMRVATTGGTPANTYNLGVTGSYGSLSHTPNAKLIVTAPLADNASCASMTAPATVNPGQTVPITVIMNNNGSFAWPVAGGYALGSKDSANWPPATIALPAGITARYWKVQNDQPTTWAAWKEIEFYSGATKLSPTIVDGTPGYINNAQNSLGLPAAIDNNLFTQWNSGTSPSPSYIILDMGSAVNVTKVRLDSQGSPYRDVYIKYDAVATTVNVAYHYTGTPADATWVELNLGGVAIGGQAKFTFNSTAPASPGTYNVSYQMQKNGAWFGGVCSASITVNTIIPVNPSNFQANNSTCERIAFTWTDNSNNETGFRIYRNTTNNPATATRIETDGTIGANATSYNYNIGANYTNYYYFLAAYNAAGESTRVPLTGGSIAAQSCGQADITIHDKDIAAINGVVRPFTPNSGTDPLDAATSQALKVGDVIRFSINLRNTGAVAATGITIRDTLINMVQPDSGWNAKYINTDTGAQIGGAITPSIAVGGTTYNQTLIFDLSNSTYNIPAGQTRSLQFEAKLAVDPAYQGNYPRFQNSFRANYAITPGGASNMVSGATPLLFFNNGKGIPEIIEIP